MAAPLGPAEPTPLPHGPLAMAAAPAALQGLVGSGEDSHGIMQTASSLPPAPKTSLACALPLPAPSSIAACHLPDRLARGKLNRLSSASIASEHGLSGPLGRDPPAQSTTQMPEPGTRPRFAARHPACGGAASARRHAPALAWRGPELPVALRSWVPTVPPATPRDWAVQLELGLGNLPAPTKAAASRKDGTPGRDHIILIFWEITCFLGTHGSPPKRGLKPPALRPNQGRRWAVTVCANRALPQHQPSVVPQPPLPPEVSGCSIAGHGGPGFPPGLKRPS